jgi:acyl carrier protein
MRDEDIADRVKAIIGETLELDEDWIWPESRIFEDLCADPMDLAILVSNLELAFDIQIGDAALYGVDTVEDLTRTVMAALQG